MWYSVDVTLITHCWTRYCQTFIGYGAFCVRNFLTPRDLELLKTFDLKIISHFRLAVHYVLNLIFCHLVLVRADITELIQTGKLTLL